MSQDRKGFPPTVVVPGKGTAYFQFIAPITGDAVYKGQTTKQGDFHAICTNPAAFERQAAMLRR